MNNDETVAAMDTLYTSSSGKTSKLGELPLPYLINIKNKLLKTENFDNALAGDLMTVIAIKQDEAEFSAQQKEVK